MLRDLLRTTRARIHCLVRGADPGQARQRLAAGLEWYGLSDDVDLDRVSVLVGDLAAPGLGLPPETFDRLARTVDVVWHAGATVHWLRPYPELRDANVGGTQEILRLAARHRPVPVHHVSTTGVFAGPGEVPLRVTDPTGPAEALPSGYLQTKWVGEQLVEQARERGLPVSVYRVDVICGDRNSGACQTRDFVWLSLKGMLHARAVPADLAGAVHMLPVDHVSAVITTLARDTTTHNRTFHLFNEHPLPFTEMVDGLRAAGYRLDPLDPQRWLEHVQQDPANPLLPLLEAFQLMNAHPGSFYPPIDTTGTRAALPPHLAGDPVIDGELFTRYVDFFVRAGHYPAADPERD